MARVSSRKRSLIEWSWSSIPFNAASTADKSVTLVAGYTAICKQQHQHPWMKTWTKKRRERERERDRDCCGQWRGLEARQCECWTKTSTTPETSLLLLSSPPYLSLSLSLSKIELNWIIVFDFSDSDLCYAIVTFYYFEILGNDSGGNIGYVSPNLFFKRRRLKCPHWPPTTAWITNLYFFFFF